jgi:glycosyltransferase involved in cell wall biosynthesis
MDPRRFTSSIVCGPETGAEGSLHEECRSRGVVVRIEPSLVRRTHPWLDSIALARLTGIIRAGRYDIVHTHSSKAGILGRIAARLAGVRTIVHTAHGWAFSREDSRLHHALWVNLERACARVSDAIVVVGASDRELGLAEGVGDASRYHLIRSGIEVEAYRDIAIARDDARAGIGIPAGAFVVGSVGRLSRQKSPLDLLAAFEHLARTRADAHLVVVGDGPDRAEVEAAIQRAGLAGRVWLLGLRRDVPELLRAFDVFALASRWEGLPRVFPQAMAAGLPIVATRVAGAPDAVLEGVSGWLVDVGDTAAFGRRLVQLAQDPDLLRRMGTSGRERVEEFSARRMVDRLGDLYAALLERTARP